MVMVYWRGSRSGFVYNTLILFFRNCLFIVLSSGEGGIALGKKRVWPVCKETHGIFGVGFRKGEGIIFYLLRLKKMAYSGIDFTVH